MDLTATERRVYDLLAAYASQGLACPTNDTITHLLGWVSSSAASQIINQIEIKGFITVQRAPRHRKITIVATGDVTQSHRSATRDAEAHRKRRSKPVVAQPPVKPPLTPINALRAQMSEEAHAFIRARTTAHGGPALTDDRKSGVVSDVIREGRGHLFVDRDPCFFCGARRDVHDEQGCAQWRPS